MNEQCEDASRESETTVRPARPAAPGLAASAAAFWRGEAGQTLVEYALVLMLITVVCITILGTLGDVLITTYYNRIANMLPG